MWWLHVLNYVVELLQANEGENDGELLLNMCIVCHMFMHHKSWDIYIKLRWLNTLYSNEGDYDVLLTSWGDDLVVGDGTACM